MTKLDGMFTDEGMEKARRKAIDHIKGDLIPFLRNIANKVVSAPQTLTEEERIFHETAMHYDAKRDRPDTPQILSFADWCKSA